jgi:hypothetical protein
MHRLDRLFYTNDLQQIILTSSKPRGPTPTREKPHRMQTLTEVKPEW